ncbi:hypothetical protein GCM10009805_22810 [Leucobacter chromiireducens subsp. solipictus]
MKCPAHATAHTKTEDISPTRAKYVQKRLVLDKKPRVRGAEPGYVLGTGSGTRSRLGVGERNPVRPRGGERNPVTPRVRGADTHSAPHPNSEEKEVRGAVMGARRSAFCLGQLAQWRDQRLARPALGAKRSAFCLGQLAQWRDQRLAQNAPRFA